MKQFQYVIKDELGLHARPAGQLVKAVTSLKSDVKLEVKGKTVDARRIMGVMQLAAKCGDTIFVTCEGQGEEEAAAKLQAFMQSNL